MRRSILGVARSLALGGLLALVVALPPAAQAQKSVNADSDKVAIKGYDAVAYFTEGRPVKGKGEFEFRWEDARWQFSSAAHRDAFAAEPERYQPQYGGFCALGLAMGKVVDVDPESWTIVDGKLYLNYDKKFREQWRANAAENIKQADANWPKLKPQN